MFVDVNFFLYKEYRTFDRIFEMLLAWYYLSEDIALVYKYTFKKNRREPCNLTMAPCNIDYLCLSLQDEKCD